MQTIIDDTSNYPPINELTDIRDMLERGDPLPRYFRYDDIRVRISYENTDKTLKDRFMQYLLSGHLVVRH